MIAQADFFLDLHSGGVKLIFPSMVGYDANDPHSRDAALAFGASVLWGHPRIAPGRTISFAAEQGIPWLYTEARGAGRIDQADLELFKRGVTNLLRHLEILPGKVEPVPVSHHLFGDGSIESAHVARQYGFLIPNVRLLEKVAAGQELGHLAGVHGETLEVVRAACDGVVAVVREFPVVAPGDPLFLITGMME